MEELRAFVIDQNDNVATALTEIPKENTARLIGETKFREIMAADTIPTGHKIALQDIQSGADIIKYGVTIGRATVDIKKGSWVHLHVMHSIYDERSSHLDIMTGAPKDTVYE